MPRVGQMRLVVSVLRYTYLSRASVHRVDKTIVSIYIEEGFNLKLDFRRREKQYESLALASGTEHTLSARNTGRRG
jgi:hypothetical protein